MTSERIVKEIDSTVAVNNAGAGNIAGIGVGNNGEPGIKKRNKPKSLWNIIQKRQPPNVKK